ncbi:MAG: class I SAM-dependent methyltransferase [Ilumatobacteraceae bacterium]
MARRRSASSGSTDAGSVDAEIEATLEGLEGATHYRDWLLELAAPHLGGRLLEVGAGRGTYSPFLREFCHSLVAVEPATRGAEEIRRRCGGLEGIEVVEGVVSDIHPIHLFDSAVMLNVLEHIPDDAATLREIAERMNPGGVLVVWVPAFPSLLGEFDRAIGHVRRYRRRQLRSLAESTGWSVEECRYANLPGFFAWWIVVRLLGRTPTAGGAAEWYDRRVVPIVRAVERRVRPPFGQSLLLVARRR